MISYSSMDNMYGYNTNNLQCGMYAASSNYGNQLPYGYCPYRAQYGSTMDYQGITCPYNAGNGYYQYSPVVNCITPNYGTAYSAGNTQRDIYNGELKMRTVKIKDVVD